MNGLVRTKAGTVVHTADCSTLGNEVTSSAIPWQWAEGRDAEELRLTTAMVGARACKTCKPFDRSS